MEVINMVKKIADKEVLRGIDFQLYPGEITGLIGRNGSGKTTLFRTIMGEYLMDEGIVVVDGVTFSEDIGKRAEIFYLDTEYRLLQGYNCQQIANLFKNVYPHFQREKFFKLLELHQFTKSARYRSYSKGRKALFNIILAVSSGAKFLIFDEPFDGLDILVKKQALRLLLEEVSEEKYGVLISSHNLRELESIVDRALILKDGQIVKQFSLEAVQELTRKIQLVFKTKEIPAIVQKEGTIISIQGRVLVCVFERYDEWVKEKILAEDPVLFEELPLSLEDIFSAKLTLEEDYQIFE